MKAMSSPSSSVPPRIWRPPKYQTKNTPKLMKKLVIMKNTTQTRSAETLTARRSSLRRSKRWPSRRSWAKALTTLMPRIDSFRWEDRRPHFADQRCQYASIRLQIRLLPMMIGGTGSSTSRVSSQFM